MLNSPVHKFFSNTAPRFCTTSGYISAGQSPSCAHAICGYTLLAVASGIDTGSPAKSKPFINAPRPDPMPTERPVGRSPTGFAEEGPCPEDQRHPRKAQRRGKQDGRGVTRISKRHMAVATTAKAHACPKTPTQIPEKEKEKEKETGSRRNKTRGYKYII
ncbi:hypothetical protein BU17DRAFT_65977 [Hysterangium stoloniferum]|nr:hypothetical protein BU17DRAFT_65977 [Hysterangium stoloniferum]